MMKKKLNKAVALVAMMSLAFGIVGSNFNLYKTDAATSLQNIFTEALEETTLEDNNRWVRPKTDSIVEIKNIGRQTLCVPSDGLAVGFQYNEQINLQDGQYVEMALTFENMNASAVIDFAFTGEKAASYEELSSQNPESVSLYADPAWMRGVLNSTNAQTLTELNEDRKTLLKSLTSLDSISKETVFRAMKLLIAEGTKHFRSAKHLEATVREVFPRKRKKGISQKEK